MRHAFPKLGRSMLSSVEVSSPARAQGLPQHANEGVPAAGLQSRGYSPCSFTDSWRPYMRGLAK